MNDIASAPVGKDDCSTVAVLRKEARILGVGPQGSRATALIGLIDRQSNRLTQYEDAVDVYRNLLETMASEIHHLERQLEDKNQSLVELAERYTQDTTELKRQLIKEENGHGREQEEGSDEGSSSQE